MRLAATMAVLMMLGAPAIGQEMTATEEAAYTALWQLTQQGQDLLAAGDLAGAEAAFADVLALVERDLPDEALTRAAALHNLAAVRADLGQFVQAEAMARAALDIRRRLGEAGAIASSERLLGTILHDLGQLDEARALIEASVVAQLNDANVPRVSLEKDMAALAELTALLGDPAAAMQILGQLEPYLPQMTPSQAVAVYAGMGRVQSIAGRPELAEAAYRQVLTLSAGLAFGAEWRPQDQAVALGNLGTMLLRQGRAAEAEPLFRQALTGAQGAVAANLLDGLGAALAAQGVMQAAWQAQRQALDLRLAALPEDHAQVAASFATLGATLLRAGEFAVAEQTLSRAVALLAQRNDGLRQARAALALGAAEAALGKPGFARAKAALADLQAILPKGHPDLVRAGFSTAWLGLAEGQAPEALSLARGALAGFAVQAGRVGADATIAAAQEPDMRRQVLALVDAAYEVDPVGLMDEAFQAAQWATASKAARATRRMVARFASEDDALGQVVRAKQDLVDLWSAKDAELLERLARGADSAAVQAEMAQIDARIAQAEAAILAANPQYEALVSEHVLTLAEAQALLGPDEALLMIVPAVDASYVFAVSATSAAWHRTDLGQEAMSLQIKALRADLDPTQQTRSAAALTEDAPKTGPSFDRGTAFALYQSLVAPVQPVLAEASRVLVVADGPIASLPLAVLVGAEPQGDDGDPKALTDTEWLAKRYAFATLPGVQSLAGLRDRVTPSDRAGFAGFGAPDFGGTSQPVALAGFFDGALARAAALQGLAPLPATRAELRGLARVLGADTADLRLGADATEAAVRDADLSEVAVIAFATHGLLAGEITGLAEPALAFTPPAVPSPLDDGLLTASEAARLKLRADWVILSACNTAAADGTPGAEGLSGLAQAFLYAGARGLLVSHWPVRDDAAAALTQAAVAARGKGVGRADALRRSMLDLMQKPGMAHPMVWAPFVVVGDGR
jgi:CHAT domain-containing protein/tetratricopeptide (TPR) repeat protein